MQLFTESTIALTGDAPFVNEISVHRHTAPLLVEIRDTQVRLESCEPFYVMRRGTCLVINGQPRSLARLTPLYSGYQEEGQPDVIDYNRETGDANESHWSHNWFDKDVVDWRDKQIELLRINHKQLRKRQFLEQYRENNLGDALLSPVRRKGMATEDKVFREAERLFLRENKQAMNDAVQKDVLFMDEWLRDVYPGERETLEKKVVVRKQEFIGGSLKEKVWSFSGVSPKFGFLNMHGDSYAIDVYNRTLCEKRIVAGNGASILAPYQHLHMVMRPCLSKLETSKSAHYLPFPTTVPEKRDNDEEEREFKKLRIEASDQV